MSRPKIYCEIDFYINLRSNTEIPYTDEYGDNVRAVDKFVCKSDIFFNISASDFMEKTECHPNLFKLWKKSANGECGIEFLSEEFPRIENFEEEISVKPSYLKAIFLSCAKAEICKEVEENYGVKVFNIESAITNPLIYPSFSITIKNGTKSHRNWNFLKNLRHPCNSLILVDNFTLLDINIIDKNIIAILDNIVPDNLRIPFHLSIFTKTEHEMERRLEKIVNAMTNLRPSMDMKITLHRLNGEVHDRTLLTNYMILDSGVGFDLFTQNGARQQTRIIGYFYWTDMVTNEKVPETLLGSMRNIYNNACSNQYLTNYWGDKENRLLEN